MPESVLAREAAVAVATRKPRLGFLGVGWIGENRLQAIARAGIAEPALVCDSVPALAERAHAASGAAVAGCLDDMLAAGLDGLVIATPSALHAEQVTPALQAGLAVFCQKPLGRTAAEVRQVVAAARAADRLLALDLSYRFTASLQQVRAAIRSGELGELYAGNLVFHNAYGPDKSWFFDPALSGGGCLMDLGIHLVDAALWLLDFPSVSAVSSRLFAQGRPLPPSPTVVEDFATARLDLATGAVVDLACSWRLPAGQDCVLAMEFYGTKGGVAFRNVGGSFYDFIAERYEGTRRTLLAQPPDAWPGRAAVAWAERLAAGERFDATNEELLRVAEVLDAIYGR